METDGLLGLTVALIDPGKEDPETEYRVIAVWVSDGILWAAIRRNEDGHICVYDVQALKMKEW